MRYNVNHIHIPFHCVPGRLSVRTMLLTCLPGRRRLASRWLPGCRRVRAGVSGTCMYCGAPRAAVRHKAHGPAAANRQKVDRFAPQLLMHWLSAACFNAVRACSPMQQELR